MNFNLSKIITEWASLIELTQSGVVYISQTLPVTLAGLNWMLPSRALQVGLSPTTYRVAPGVFK